MPNKAFISYSHAADGKLASAIQGALTTFAKPWYRLRTMRVFRDMTSLSANAALWPSIVDALQASEWFLLLAREAAAQSPWVRKEISWWIANRPVDHFLILLADGDIVWDETSGDFDSTRTTALPAEVLRGRFTGEPRWVDFRWAVDPSNLSLRHTQVRAAILDIAAPLLGRPKDALDSEEVRQHRRTKRIATAAGIGLVGLTISSVAAGLIANQQRKSALSRELAAASTGNLSIDPELSLLLASQGSGPHRANRRSGTGPPPRPDRHPHPSHPSRPHVRGHQRRIQPRRQLGDHSR
jgi:hypothetical protein